jgi:hypothetical protein
LLSWLRLLSLFALCRRPETLAALKPLNSYIRVKVAKD